MSRAVASNEVLVLGASPRVRLLPPEIEQRQKSRSIRRSLIFGLIGAVALVVLGVGAATIGVVTSNAALLSEQSKTSSLLLEQSKYSKVVSVQQQVNDIKAVQPIAATGEILWEPLSASLQATLPSGTTITGIHSAIDSTSIATVSVPLQGAHVATITIDALSPQAPISNWLDNLASVKGFVDAVPGSVTLDPATGKYIVSVTMHVDQDALANRFVAGKK